MNEDINLRIKFIQEVERHPFLYDNNHVLYNHRDKIESTWQKIGQMFGEGSVDCKKKWRLIRCSYTRSLKAQAKQKSSFGLAKGYYMAPHLRFLDPFLKSRSYTENNMSEEDESSEVAEESMEGVDGNHMLQVTLDNVKVERDGVDDVLYEEVNEDVLGGVNPSEEFVTGRKRPHLVDGGHSPNYPKVMKFESQSNTKRDLTANEMYLLSLTPYLEDMTERQKLTFQKSVVEIIEKIKYGT